MTYDELEQAVTDYFGDKSRSQRETKTDLMSLAEHCETLADTLDGGDDD